MITRREFAKQTGKAGLAVMVLGIATQLAGCSVAGDIVAWAGVGLASFNSIVAVLQSNGIVLGPTAQALIQDVQAAFTALEGAAREYGSANPPPIGSLAKLQLTLKVVVDNLSKFLSDVSLPGGNILTLIGGLASIIFSTIAAFQNQLPTTPQLVGGSLKLGGVFIPINAKKRNRKQFKKEFNSDLNAAVRAGVEVPQGAYLHESFLEKMGL